MINAGGAFSALGKWESFCFYQYTCTPGKTFNYYSHLLISESERHNFLYKSENLCTEVFLDLYVCVRTTHVN
jgi:hypothetical protein